MMKRKLIILGTAFCLLFVAFVGAGAAGRMLAQPTAVATVDIAKVMKGLKERIALEADIKIAQQEFVAKFDEKKKELQGMQDQLNMVEGTSAYDEIRRSAEMKAYNMQAWQQYEQARLQRETLVGSEYIYRKIAAAVDRIATAYGYEIVIAKESLDSLGNYKNQQELQAQMMTRKVLYSADTVDLTTQVITTMNNDYDNAK
ncbi:OmpH family outer membrane protein [Planctomycetota bacterium]|nr:OmpH family outer membrane protein [Planctomycetota bacterium]